MAAEQDMVLTFIAHRIPHRVLSEQFVHIHSFYDFVQSVFILRLKGRATAQSAKESPWFVSVLLQCFF